MTQRRDLHVVFVSTMPPDRGNLAEYGGYLSRALAEQPGVARVTVLANRLAGSDAAEEVTGGRVVRRVWRHGSTWSVLALAWQARRLQPDLVHINAGIRTWGKGRLVSLAGAALPLVLRMLGVRVVTTLHTIGETVRLEQMNEHVGWFTRVGMRVASWLYLRSHAVTVTLASMRAALAERFRVTHVAHVPHGTYGARVADAALAPARVLSFGFWGAFKDARPLVDAVATLRAEGLSTELVLAGGPHPYFPEIYERLREELHELPWVRFTGYVPEDELSTLFEQSAVVVLPYRTNAGASGVLNLCRSYARPVVISNDVGLVEQLQQEGGAAFVFAQPAGLVDALRRVLGDPALQLEMGRANLEVARRLTLTTQAAQMVRLYRDVTAMGRVAWVAPPPPVADAATTDPHLASFLGWSSPR